MSRSVVWLGKEESEQGRFGGAVNVVRGKEIGKEDRLRRRDSEDHPSKGRQAVYHYSIWFKVMSE